MHGMNLTLTDQEKGIAMVDDWERKSGGECKFLLVGRLLTSKVFEFEDLAYSLKYCLGLGKGLEIINLQEDRILFRVFDEARKHRILEGRHGLIRVSLLKGSLLLLSDVPENMNPLHVDLSCCSFYVHIHDLPLSMQTRKTAVRVANSIGVFEEYDETAALGVSLRVLVKIKVDQPLTRFLKVKSSVTDHEVMVRFTYENLPLYCYLCGHLDHTRRECELRDEFDLDKPIDELPYGCWLHEKSRRPKIFRDADFSRKHASVMSATGSAVQDMVGGSFQRRKISNTGTGKMKIVVKQMSGSLTYEVKGSTLVHHLKLMIEDREEIPEDDFVLVRGGRRLAESRTLIHYNLQDEDTIHLLLHVRGG